jgi:predicted TPR repeat methyltransferase
MRSVNIKLMSRKQPKAAKKRDNSNKRKQLIAETLQSAIQLHQQEQLDQAEKIYRQVLRKDPGHIDALHFLGLLRYQQGKTEQGLHLIRKALLKRPDYADAHNNLGIILKKQGKSEQAIMAFKTCLELTPDNTSALSNLGILFKEQGDFKQAIECYQQSIALNPAQTPAYLNLANILLSRDPVKAATLIQQWLTYDPDNSVALHMLASCTGEHIPQRASDDYIKDTFDRFAEKFDEHLEKLDYQAPQLVETAVENVYGEPQGSLNILDAGCGTGLCGPLLRPYANQLEGVDLSGGMIEKAGALDVYDGLFVNELTAFLNTQKDTYDLIASADTLNYFGVLQQVFLAVFSALKPGGYFVFTLEELGDQQDDNGFHLNHHGRYSHSREKARDSLQQSGLNCKSMNSGVLRTEKDESVRGLVITAVRP